MRKNDKHGDTLCNLKHRRNQQKNKLGGKYVSMGLYLMTQRINMSMHNMEIDAIHLDSEEKLLEKNKKTKVAKIEDMAVCYQ